MEFLVEDIAAIKHHFGQFSAPQGCCYDWDSEAYLSPSLPIKKMLSLEQLLAAQDAISSLLGRIKNVLDYIILFRDELTCLKAQRLLEYLVVILNMDIETSAKAQVISNQWLSWLNWMQAVHPGRDLLREECESLGLELVTLFNC